MPGVQDLHFQGHEEFGKQRKINIVPNQKYFGNVTWQIAHQGIDYTQLGVCLSSAA